MPSCSKCGIALSDLDSVDCSKSLCRVCGRICGLEKAGQEPGEAKDGIECEDCPYFDAEEEIFKALGLAYVEPKDREVLF